MKFRFFSALAFVGLLAMPALAQQPTPNEIISVLVNEKADFQREVEQAYLSLARSQEVAAKTASDAEVQKSTLIEWLKAAQAKKE